MKSYGVTIQMKATKQYFPVVLFIMLYKVILTFDSVNEILTICSDWISWRSILMRRFLRNFTSSYSRTLGAVPRGFFEQEPKISSPDKEVEKSKHLKDNTQSLNRYP